MKLVEQNKTMIMTNYLQPHYNAILIKIFVYNNSNYYKLVIKLNHRIKIFKHWLLCYNK